MEVHNTLHMVGGEGETSYAMNSSLQKDILTKAKPYVEKTVTDLLSENFPKCLRIADLGCSSGPNSLLPTSVIIDAVHAMQQKTGRPSIEIQVFLNDLLGNDFNSTFGYIPSFYERFKKEKGDKFGPCFIAGVPGSFYGRLFPSQTLSFVHSSNCLHWLSQVPEGIEDNKGNICMSTTSPSNVFKSYLNQFQRDFNTFLKSRSEEVVPGGRVVIIMMGRESLEAYGVQYHIWDLLTRSLNDMVSKGLVDKAKFDAFNLPYYAANKVEVKEVIENEGSFHIDVFEELNTYWDSIDKDKLVRGRSVAKIIRAVSESLICSHFGEKIVNEVFDRYANYAGENLVKDKAKILCHLLCLRKK